MMETLKDVVQWGTIYIPYEVQFARRKTLSISVHPDLSVNVRAPQGIDLETIQNFVRKRGAWINRSWRDFEQYLPKQPTRRYVSGETHRYLGRQYRLKAEKGEKDSVQCIGGYLRVTTKCDPGPDKVKTLLDDWYRSHAKVIFHERLMACYQKVVKEGILLPRLQIRKMAKRWGSFSSAGRITLNLLLITAPKECIDYVILHELCHFKIKHHCSRFWKLMDRLMPDYEDRRKKLNMYAA